MAGNQKRDAAFALQYALRAAGVTLSVDGFVGNETRKAVAASSSPSVAALQSEFGMLFTAPVTQSGRKFVPQAELDGAIEIAAAKYGQDVVPYLRLMVKLENFPAESGVYTKFDGTFRGVAQFGESTWDDVRSRLDDSIGPFSNVTSTEKSMVAAAAYWASNRALYQKLARKQSWGETFSPQLGYLFHQQGAGGAEHFLRTGSLMFPKQSADSVAVMSAARRMVV